MRPGRTEHPHPDLDLQVLPHDLHQSPCKKLALKNYSLEKNKAEIVLYITCQVLLDKEEVVYVKGIIIALTKCSSVECHIIFFMGKKIYPCAFGGGGVFVSTFTVCIPL